MSKMASVDVKLCVLCQEKTIKKLICPANSRVASNLYKNIGDNIEVFYRSDCLHIKIHDDVLSSNNGVGDYFIKNSTSWHKECVNMFNNLKRQRTIKYAAFFIG